MATLPLNQCMNRAPVASRMFAQQMCLPLVLSSSHDSPLNQPAAIAHSLLQIQRRLIQSYAVGIDFFQHTFLLNAH